MSSHSSPSTSISTFTSHAPAPAPFSSSSSSSSLWTRHSSENLTPWPQSTVLHTPPPPSPPYLSYTHFPSPSALLSSSYLPSHLQPHSATQLPAPPMVNMQQTSYSYPASMMLNTQIPHPFYHSHQVIDSSYSSPLFIHTQLPQYSLSPHSSLSYDAYTTPLRPPLPPSHISSPFPSSSSFSSSASSSSELYSVKWEVIDARKPQTVAWMRVNGWHDFQNNVRSMVGGNEIKVYHSYSEQSRVRVANESAFHEAVSVMNTLLSVWVCQPGQPSPPLHVDTSSPVVTQHRHVVPPIPMAPLGTPPSTSRLPPLPPSTPSSQRNQQKASPSSSSHSSGSSTPVSAGSARSTMANRVKKRDGGVCVFLHTVPVKRENHNCHILAASPLERRLNGDWYSSHRKLLLAKGKGCLDDFVMSVKDYEASKAPRGFSWGEHSTGLSHIIALPCVGRENVEVQYATNLGLYAHQQFNEALGLGRVKLTIHEEQIDSNNTLGFSVSWSLSDRYHPVYFKGRGIGEPTSLQPYPMEGKLKLPSTVEAQDQWPQKIVFELYSEVWYPYQRWVDRDVEEHTGREAET